MNTLSVDPQLLTEVHRRFATGATVVTTSALDDPRGLAVNAFASISLDPPLILVCVAGRANTHERLFLSDHFAVNILAHDQQSVARRFATSGGDKFSDLEWREGTHGSPLLEGVAAWLEASIEKRIRAYTHTIFIGRVLDASFSDRPPLLYLGGRFFDGSCMTELTPDG